MAKSSEKPQTSAAVDEQPTPSAKGRKKAKARCQPRSRGSVKVRKTTAGVKRSPRGSLKRKAPPKTSASPRMPKKARGPTPSGHYRKFNKKTNLNEPCEDQESQESQESPESQESVENSTTSSDVPCC